MNTVPQHVDEGKILVCSPTGQTRFIVKDGCYFNPTINEWEVWLDDEVAAYATTEHNAIQYYLQALSYRKDHYERGNDDIPFLGEPVTPAGDEFGGLAYGLHRSEF